MSEQCNHTRISSSSFATCLGCKRHAQDIVNEQAERIKTLEAAEKERDEFARQIVQMALDNATLEMELSTLRESVPEYRRALHALKLFDAEYVGQPVTPLWKWAWEQTAKPPTEQEQPK